MAKTSATQLTQEQMMALLTMVCQNGMPQTAAKAATKKAEKKPSKKAVEGEKAAKAVKGMAGVKSYKENEWTWYCGDTKPHKDKLKSMGCRYSGRRQQWYKIG